MPGTFNFSNVPVLGQLQGIPLFSNDVNGNLCLKIHSYVGTRILQPWIFLILSFTRDERGVRVGMLRYDKDSDAR
jgi:hypothetical protein